MRQIFGLRRFGAAIYGALFGLPILGFNGFWFLLVETVLTIYLYLYVKFEEVGA